MAKLTPKDKVKLKKLYKKYEQLRKKKLSYYRKETDAKTDKLSLKYFNMQEDIEEKIEKISDKIFDLENKRKVK